ncbi:MAG: phosphoribosylaminoimidazolesuccinocarboxamide synthase [Planctomycetes bacterium]|nr:phosphoribosylaminoimidazolesuccinocarboxamide synthase [Planctomycetota bacterium]
MRAVHQTEVAGLELLNRGKVRDIYAVGDDHLLLVASDRISAFDVVLPRPVPGKGIILTQLSIFWFELLQDVTPNHVVETDVMKMPDPIPANAEVLRGRSLLVKRAHVHPAECIARGFLLGSGWKDYQASGTLCGIELPEGLKKNHRFDPPLFTPSTKAEAGAHDENISYEALVGAVGNDLAAELKDRTLQVFDTARRHAESRGVVICDTKFEWGEIAGKTILVDEVLTPDSSRFWRKEDADTVLPAGNPPSYDKQVVRDFLETLDWNKKDPGPELPDEILQTARGRYIEIFERICGRSVPCLDD